MSSPSSRRTLIRLLSQVRDYLEAIGLHGKTEKSKPKKIKARVDASLGIIGNKESNSVEKKLLKVSNKDHKKLLFSLNTDQSWFDQVSSHFSSLLILCQY